MTDLNELLGITEEDERLYRETPRQCCGRPNGDGSDCEERLCSEGNCVEVYCACGSPRGMGWGPVGCACQDPSLEVETK